MAVIAQLRLQEEQEEERPGEFQPFDWLRQAASGRDIMKVMPRKTGATDENERDDDSSTMRAPRVSGSTCSATCVRSKHEDPEAVSSRLD